MCQSSCKSSFRVNASKQVLSFVQTSSLINDGAQMQEIAVEENWTTPLITYLRSGIQGILLRARYQESLLISSTPAGQRTSQSHESDLAKNHHDPA